MNINPLLLNDFYKLTHMLQYPGDVAKLVSYFTPRKSRLKDKFGIDHVVAFGISGFVHDYLESYKTDFFGRSWASVELDVRLVLAKGLRYHEDLISKTLTKIKELHDLGYLPIAVTGVPDGTPVPMGTPFLEIQSTHPGMPWVAQVIEPALSAYLWHPMVNATIAAEYRAVAESYYKATTDKPEDAPYAMTDFSMRGQESIEGAVAASAAWLTAMYNSSTVAAEEYLRGGYITAMPDYDSNKTTRCPIHGLTSTEHSVMCTYAAMGEETDAFVSLLDTYKNVSFAMVLDSYDFWGALDSLITQHSDLLMDRAKRGLCVFARHDSADPVEAICGIEVVSSNDLQELIKSGVNTKVFVADTCEVVAISGNSVAARANRTRTPEEMGMVEYIYHRMGGTVNSKGYIELVNGLKAVYGDSITLSRAKEIYRRLAAKKFAANCVSLGVGSFSFQAIEDEDGVLYPLTRDTFSMAVKCTYAERMSNGQPVNVVKRPKGFDEKHSATGVVRMTYNNDTGRIAGVEYESDMSQLPALTAVANTGHVIRSGMPVLYYADGLVVGKQSFFDVRRRVGSYAEERSFNLLAGLQGEFMFNTIKAHITKWADETNAKNFVVGLSGGKDSTVVAMLLTEIFGPERVYAVTLPVHSKPMPQRYPEDDTEIAWSVSRLCKLDTTPNNRHMFELPIESPVTSISSRIRSYVNGAVLTDAMTINLPSRLRMVYLYALAQQVDGRVINTSNLSEDTVGYATQFGDNAGAYAPLQNLTVTEVRILGMWLACCKFGLGYDEARKLIYKTPADGLQPDTDEDRLGFTYEALDAYIRCNEGTEEFKEKIQKLYKLNKFKTDTVQMPKPSFGYPNYVTGVES